MDRWVKLCGANNTRDLGGLRTADGKCVKCGTLYRSGELSGLSASGFRMLKEKYGVSTLVDLRTAEEIEGCPVPACCPIPVVHIPILRQAMRGITRDSEPMRKKMQAILAAGMSEAEFMRECYKEMVFSPEARIGYRRLFDLLLSREKGAVLFYCSAGRDRTGIITWLILSALGVPEDTILDDYMLTPGGIRRKAIGVRFLKALRYFDRTEADFALAFMLPSKDRILGALEQIKENYGSISAFLCDGIGLTQGELEQIRENCLES